MATTAAGNETVETGKAGSARAFSGFERMVAWRYLRARRKEAFISVIAGFSFIGIMLGVATLIIVMAVMNGFRTELVSRILGINGHMIVQAVDQPLSDYAGLAERFATVPGVTMALPLVEGQTLASGREGAGTGALVRGIRPDDLTKLSVVSSNIRSGDMVGFATGQGVLIGSRMAAQLGLSAGDTITLVSPEGDVTPLGVNPRVKSYPVSAIFEIGMSEYDASIIYMPLEEAQLYFNVEGIVQSIELFISDPDAVDELRPQIEAAAERQIFITDWRQRNAYLLLGSAGRAQRHVHDPDADRAGGGAQHHFRADHAGEGQGQRTSPSCAPWGRRAGAIMRIFFMTGAAIGTAGTLAGVVMGVVVCLNIESIRQFFSWVSGTVLFDPELYFLSQLPADMNASETVSVVIMALSLSFMATIFPAWRASRLDPVQALRYE